jgi:hypothetical protein
VSARHSLSDRDLRRNACQAYAESRRPGLAGLTKVMPKITAARFSLLPVNVRKNKLF